MAAVSMRRLVLADGIGTPYRCRLTRNQASKHAAAIAAGTAALTNRCAHDASRAGQIIASAMAGASASKVILTISPAPKASPSNIERRHVNPCPAPLTARRTQSPPSAPARASLLTRVPFSARPGSRMANIAAIAATSAPRPKSRHATATAIGASVAMSRALITRKARTANVVPPSVSATDHAGTMSK